jgi:hypothetical protein
MLDSLLIPFEATTNGVGLKFFVRDPDCQDFVTNEGKQWVRPPVVPPRSDDTIAG